MTATTAASVYVERHLPILTKYSYSKRFRPITMEPDEFRSELVISVLDKYSTFRHVASAKPCPYCDRLGCSTWLGWRARKINSNYYRSLKRSVVEIHAHSEFQMSSTQCVVQTTEEEPVRNIQTDIMSGVVSSYGSPEKIFAKAQLSEILAKATPAQTEALISKLEGWTGDDIWENLGIGINGRNYRLRTLMDSI